MAKANDPLIEASHVYHQLLNDSQSLILATINEDGTPLASYAPFVVDDQQRFYLFTSDLATHTANLRRSKMVSIMLIEEEAAAKQIFARRRLTLQCGVTILARDSVDGQAALEQYRTRFGKMVGLLETLPDFRLFILTPVSGQLVAGFGQAYELSGDRLATFSHRRR